MNSPAASVMTLCLRRSRDSPSNESDVAIGNREQPAVGDGDAMCVARQIGEHLLGAGERTLGVDDPFALAQGSEIGAERSASLSSTRSPKNCSSPAACNAVRPSRNNRRNRRESTRTGRKKPGRHGTQRLPSGEMPPPGTMQWTCG